MHHIHMGTLQTQQGVYRTNCLDCLDRTNVVQARISQLVLHDIMRSVHSQVTAGGQSAEVKYDWCL